MCLQGHAIKFSVCSILIMCLLRKHMTKLKSNSQTPSTISLFRIRRHTLFVSGYPYNYVMVKDQLILSLLLDLPGTIKGFRVGVLQKLADKSITKISQLITALQVLQARYS